MQTEQQNGQLKRTMKTRHLIMLSLGALSAQGYSSIPDTSFRQPARRARCWRILLVRWWSGWLCNAWGTFRSDAGNRRVPRLRRSLSRPGDRVYRGVALLAYVDSGAGIELYRSRVLYAVLVPAGSRLDVVRRLLRGDFALNVISTRFFAEGEFWFSLVKVITIIAFIILGGAAIFGFIPMQDGSPAPGLSNITAEGWFPHGGLPILMTMVAVNFAFSGTELIGIAAGETENPHKVIPVAIRTTIARLIIFFIGTVFVLAALIPMQQAGVEKSPFVVVFEKVGIPYAADIFNFVILTAILSAANSGLYASGRMLWSLSNEKTLPRCFARVNKNGVPLTALSVSMLGGVLALFSSVVAPDTVFVALSAISGFAVVAVWISICASHFVFRRRHVQSGQPLSALQYRAPWYPLVPVLGFILCLVACVGLWFDPSQRIALYCGLPFVALCYGAYYLTRNLTTQEPEHVAE